MRDLLGTEYNLNEIIINCKIEKKIVIFGAGKYGMHIYDLLQSNGIKVSAIFDNNASVLLEKSKYYPTESIENINKYIDFFFIIGISKVDIIKKVKKQLIEYGIKPDHIIIPLPDFKSGYYDVRIMFDDELCINAVKELWCQVREKHDNHIVDYFETNDLLNIVVIELDDVKDWLDSDLINSKVNIIKKYTSFDAFDYSIKSDAIVVMDEVNYEVIEEKLLKWSNTPVISIWDILNC